MTQALPVFDPKAAGGMNPGFPYADDRRSGVQTAETQHGNPAIAAVGGGNPRTESLVWPTADVLTRDYIVSFFESLEPGTPFIWTPLNLVAQPLGCPATHEIVIGGSQIARNLRYQFTWYSAPGETLPSPAQEAATFVNGSEKIRIKVPRFPPGVEGWRVYLRKGGNPEYRLQDTIIGSRVWEEPNDGFEDAGAEPPTKSTLAPPRKWYLADDWSEARNRGIQCYNSRRWRIALEFRELMV